MLLCQGGRAKRSPASPHPRSRARSLFPSSPTAPSWARTSTRSVDSKKIIYLGGIRRAAFSSRHPPMALYWDPNPVVCGYIIDIERAVQLALIHNPDLREKAERDGSEECIAAALAHGADARAERCERVDRARAQQCLLDVSPTGDEATPHTRGSAAVGEVQADRGPGRRTAAVGVSGWAGASVMQNGGHAAVWTFTSFLKRYRTGEVTRLSLKESDAEDRERVFLHQLSRIVQILDPQPPSLRLHRQQRMRRATRSDPLPSPTYKGGTGWNGELYGCAGAAQRLEKFADVMDLDGEALLKASTDGPEPAQYKTLDTP
ncbi:hypothetical protein AcV7_008100 [Taiwanofungus camphoratus]|nr:hypothetical protein AcV7_008100 [Antrodia cinnamomea]